MTPAVTISARQDARWRCGVKHTPAAVSWEAGHWTEDQLAELKADPMLVVVEADGASLAAQAAAATAAEAQTTPTVRAALDTALSALRRATPGEVRGFLQAMEEDPDIREKIEDAIAARAAAESTGGEAEPTRHERLVAAIGTLEDGNEDHWTKDKRPQVSALEAATGLDDVSAAERDAAFEAWKIVAGKELTGG